MNLVKGLASGQQYYYVRILLLSWFLLHFLHASLHFLQRSNDTT